MSVKMEKKRKWKRNKKTKEIITKQKQETKENRKIKGKLAPNK